MIEFTQIFAGLIVVMVITQAILVMGFSFTLFKKPVSLIGDQESPDALVVLCLRGADPFLSDCIHGLLNQDYLNYKVRIIVDHQDDPASRIVSDVLNGYDDSRVSVDHLIKPRTNCSLKCSSIVQVIETLDESVEFIAQLDADTIAHPTWLRELATALHADDVGAATGNRWYMPKKHDMGSLVRYGWNAAAVVQMYWYQIAWGGTLAVKTELFKNTDLLEKWSKAFCEDTMLHAALKKEGLRVAFVPSLIMINREECSLGSFVRWVTRQLLTARLYHPAWPGVVTHGMLTTLLPAIALSMFLYALLLGDTTTVSKIAWAFGVYEISLIVLLWPMELAVRTIAERRGESTRWLTMRGVFRFLLSIPITQVVYPIALATSLFSKSTSWRGIDYHIGGPWDIRMVEYHKYANEVAEDSSL